MAVVTTVAIAELKIPYFSPFFENLYFWPKFLSLAKNSMFCQNFYVLPKFLSLGKNSMFGQNVFVWPKFLCLANISIFGQNFRLLSLIFKRQSPFLTLVYCDYYSCSSLPLLLFLNSRKYRYIHFSGD